MGYSAATGFRVNLEYTYIDQDQLRGGTGIATPAEVVNNPSNPSLGGGEIERQTINHYLTLGASYRPNADWNFNLLVPYVLRDHTTYGNQTEPYTPAESAPDQISGAHVSNLGDVKLIANFQGILPTHNLGVQLGVKLPIGQYGSAVNFHDGPRSQPGRRSDWIESSRRCCVNRGSTWIYHAPHRPPPQPPGNRIAAPAGAGIQPAQSHDHRPA